MKIYNTLTGNKDEFVPVEEGKVKMYVCGPTVYNLIHIGNARPMIVFDTVRRYFIYKGYDVTYVSNFTDIDDKIIKRAIEEGTTSDIISKKYIEECMKDMDGMNIGKDIIHPLATEVIPDMIEMIQLLIDKGYAYDSNGTVYFRVRKSGHYGKLSSKNIDDLEAGHRDIKVTGEENKEDPLDFVLWKPKKEGEPFWESPWSEGRPGWHIECSVMARKYLGKTMDIHAGGEDLVFPHHENEVAQSEAANDAPFAKYWMHNAFLKIDNVKMSKSLGNFLTVRDISKKYDLEVLRFFMLGAHYRTPLNFSGDLMESSKTGLERIKNAARLLHERIDQENSKDTPNMTMSPEEEARAKKADDFRISFEEAMDDDFNTAFAVGTVFDLVKFINTEAVEGSSIAFLEDLLNKLVMLTEILGLNVDKKDELLDDSIEALIEERNEAKRNKNFARADEIRDILLKDGIVLEDTRNGVRWKRV